MIYFLFIPFLFILNFIYILFFILIDYNSLITITAQFKHVLLHSSKINFSSSMKRFYVKIASFHDSRFFEKWPLITLLLLHYYIGILPLTVLRTRILPIFIIHFAYCIFIYAHATGIDETKTTSRKPK